MGLLPPHTDLRGTSPPIITTLPHLDLEALKEFRRFRDLAPGVEDADGDGVEYSSLAFEVTGVPTVPHEYTVVSSLGAGDTAGGLVTVPKHTVSLNHGMARTGSSPYPDGGGAAADAGESGDAIGPDEPILTGGLDSYPTAVKVTKVLRSGGAEPHPASYGWGKTSPFNPDPNLVKPQPEDPRSYKDRLSPLASDVPETIGSPPPDGGEEGEGGRVSSKNGEDDTAQPLPPPHPQRRLPRPQWHNRQGGGFCPPAVPSPSHPKPPELHPAPPSEKGAENPQPVQPEKVGFCMRVWRGIKGCFAALLAKLCCCFSSRE